MGTVYRATDRLSGETLALKRVHTTSENLIFASQGTSRDQQTALAREFQTLAGLRHPNIISVLDYGFDRERRPFFTMPLLAGALPITQAAAKRDRDVRVRLVMQMLQALHYLHRRGILHRDLKPSNVLVTPQGQVRVLDFGLAVTQEQAEGLAGTIAYMAPEMLSGGPTTVAADLYSVGVIAYEVFTGLRPFESPDSMNMMLAILRSSPDFDLLDAALRAPAADLNRQPLEDTTRLLPNAVAKTATGDTGKRRAPPTDGEYRAFTTIVRQLLQRDPAARYASAADVVRDLNASLEKPSELEDDAIRDSFLQAATFVGREHERQQLYNALLWALDGRGSGWVVGGESGVGKSRLLEEIRIEALVKGALVLRGQGVAEGGRPYQLWREALRHLLLSITVSNAEARTLQTLVPDINSLRTKRVQPLTQAPTEDELLDVVVAVFRRITVPTVLVLEDLQWATESLRVLERLQHTWDDLPLLVLASYRTEDEPQLPERLPRCNHLKLERLSATAIAELSRSMLGDAGTEPRILDFVRQQTEGNCFFMVEVMRALAESAGRLEDISRTSIPEGFAAGGVEQILVRRLERVPEWARALLQVAAVGGRLLDVAVLAHVNNTLRLVDSVERWLVACAEVAVLDVRDDQWRFGHDKLREKMLARIPKAQRRDLHADIAEAIEAIYAETLDQHTEVLLTHWLAANDAPKSRHYAALAADDAIHASRYDDALRHVELVRKLQPTEHDQANVYLQLAVIYTHQGAFAAAHEQLDAALPLAERLGAGWVAARALHVRAEIQMAQGELETALRHAHASQRRFQALEAVAEVARVQQTIGNVYRMQGQLEAALSTLEAALNTARAANRRDIEANVLNTAAILRYQRNQLDSAITDAQAALDIARTLGAKRLEFNALNNLGGFHWIRGALQAAADFYQQAHTIADEIGYGRGVLALQNLAAIYADMGDYARAKRSYTAAIAVLRRTGLSESLAICLINLSETYNDHGHHQQAAEVAREALQLATRMKLPFQQCAAGVNLGLALLMQGQVSAALDVLQTAAGVENEEMDYEAWLALALALVRDGQLGPAQHQLQAVIARTRSLTNEDDELYAAWFGLALATLAQTALRGEDDADFSAALGYYQQALAHAGKHAGIRLHQWRLLETLQAGLPQPLPATVLAQTGLQG